MKKLITIMLLTAFVLLLSGCWSKRELNELAIVVALGIDKIDGEYLISAQVVDPSQISSKSSSSGRSPVVTFHGRGKTLFEAIRKVTTISPKKLYFAHLQLIIIGHDLALEGIAGELDFIARDNEFRTDVNVLVTPATAKNILNVMTPIEKIPAMKILSAVKNSENAWGSMLEVKVDEIINKIMNGEGNYVISAVEVLGDASLGVDQTNVEGIVTPVIINSIGLAIFKNDQLKGFLSEEESRSFSFLNDKIKDTIEIISCPEGGNLTTEITKSKTKTKGQIKRGVPKIFVQIEIEQNVAEVNCKINLTEEQALNEINSTTATIIETRIKNVLKTIQEKYEADVLGYGEVLHREDAREWKKIKDDWPQLYPELSVDVTVNVKTIGLATIQNAIVNEKKEK